MKRLIAKCDPKRVLFVTYRQTLARDIMRNFGGLGFKNYLDAAEGPSVWQSPRLIAQLDSLLKAPTTNWAVLDGEEAFEHYDMMVLGESEPLPNHFD